PTRQKKVPGAEQQGVLETIVKLWCESKKYTCRFTLKGSVDQARALASGSQDYDAYWFARSVFSPLGDKSGGPRAGPRCRLAGLRRLLVRQLRLLPAGRQERGAAGRQTHVPDPGRVRGLA